MQLSITTSVLLILLMVISSAFFSASETSLLRLNRHRLQHLSKQGNRGAKRAATLLANPDRLISLVLIGNNVVNAIAVSLAGIIGIRLYGESGAFLVNSILTVIILVLAEIVPKTLAVLYPERIAFFSSWVLLGLNKLLSPFVWLINSIAVLFIRIFGIKGKLIAIDLMSKEELRGLLRTAQAQISPRNKNMLLSVLELEEVTVSDIMVPRNEIIGIDINDNWQSIMRQITHIAYARILLYRNTLDDVIGILRVREAYRLMFEKNEFTKENLLRAADEIYFIPAQTTLNVQLIKFQYNKEQLGIVVNEYGDIEGLITIDDILEEIVGDFTTSMAPTLADEIEVQADGSIIIEGSASVRELNKNFGWMLPVDARTINGLLLETLGEIPQPNVIVKIKHYMITILNVQDNMIKRVKVSVDNNTAIENSASQ